MSFESVDLLFDVSLNMEPCHTDMTLDDGRWAYLFFHGFVGLTLDRSKSSHMADLSLAQLCILILSPTHNHSHFIHHTHHTHIPQPFTLLFSTTSSHRLPSRCTDSSLSKWPLLTFTAIEFAFSHSTKVHTHACMYFSGQETKKAVFELTLTC